MRWRVWGEAVRWRVWGEGEGVGVWGEGEGVGVVMKVDVVTCSLENYLFGVMILYMACVQGSPVT